MSPLAVLSARDKIKGRGRFAFPGKFVRKLKNVFFLALAPCACALGGPGPATPICARQLGFHDQLHGK